MDLSLPISYNGLTIGNALTAAAAGTPSSGIIANEVNVSPADVVGYTDKRATMDGIDAADVYLGARRVDATLTAFGATEGEMWDNIQDILHAFNPRIAYNADTANVGFLAFDFYQPTANIAQWPTSAYPNGLPLRLYLRPASIPSYTSLRPSQGGQSARGGSKQLRVALIARDPRKYLQTSSTISLSIGTTATSSSATYVGDYPTVGTATITLSFGTATAAYSIEGSSFSFTLDTASSTYTLDLANHTFMKDGVERDDLFTCTSWPEIGADGTVTVARTAAAGLSAFSLSYRPAFS